MGLWQPQTLGPQVSDSNMAALQKYREETLREYPGNRKMDGPVGFPLLVTIKPLDTEGFKSSGTA